MSWSFKARQVALSAGVQTAITPPVGCRSVEITNTANGALTVQSDASENGFDLLAGFAKSIDAHTRLFSTFEVAFYLTSAGGGSVVLVWS